MVQNMSYFLLIELVKVRERVFESTASPEAEITEKEGKQLETGRLQMPST